MSRANKRKPKHERQPRKAEQPVDLTTRAYREAAAGPKKGEARTARNSRQVLAIGTVADVQVLLPPPAEALDAALDTPERTVVRYSDRDVERAVAFVKATRVAPFIDTRRHAKKLKSGRPYRFTTQAVLVALHLAAATARPLWMTTLTEILCEGISNTMRNVLDLEVPARPGNTPKRLAWKEANRAAVTRAFHRLLDTIDPSILPKNRKRTWEEMQTLKKDLSIEEQHERAAALDWVCNQFIETAYLQLPEPVRARHKKHGVHLCIDATPVPLFARGKGVDNENASTDPDGGIYRRDGDHADPKQDNPFARTTTKVFFARDLHLLATADLTPGDRQYVPNLAIAMTSGIPGIDPSGLARRMFASMKHRGYAPGYLAGDILYTDQRTEAFQLPAREEGYELVLGYGENQIGDQGAHSSGMHLVEGTYYGPCLPDDLAEATRDLRAKRITLTEYQAKIRARVEFKMRTKQKAGVHGPERLTCPAAGPNPTAICALKPSSAAPRPTRQPDGSVVDLRRVIRHLPVLTNGQAPEVCRQESVTVDIEDGAKYRQPLDFASPKQIQVYNALRQGQEGVHGSVKDEGYEALDKPGRRRIRGWAALDLFSAILLAAVNTRRIIRFLELAVPDRNGDLYVPRTVRTGTHATTNNPPGGPPVIEESPPQAA